MYCFNITLLTLTTKMDQHTKMTHEICEDLRIMFVANKKDGIKNVRYCKYDIFVQQKLDDKWVGQLTLWTRTGKDVQTVHYSIAEQIFMAWVNTATALWEEKKNVAETLKACCAILANIYLGGGLYTAEQEKCYVPICPICREKLVHKSVGMVAASFGLKRQGTKFTSVRTNDVAADFDIAGSYWECLSCRDRFGVIYTNDEIANCCHWVEVDA